MFVSSSTKKTKFTDSTLEEEESSFKPALYHPLLPSLPVFSSFLFIPQRPYWTSSTAQGCHNSPGSLMSLKILSQFPLCLLSGKEAASGTLWNAAVCSWEGGLRGSHPGLGRQVTWVMPAHCQSSLMFTFGLYLTRCPQFPGLNTLNRASPNCFAFLTHPQILSILSS